MKDYYSVLKIDRGASAKEICTAFRKLAQTLHPDKGGGVEEFKELNEAYSVLSNEEKRKRYDLGEEPNSTSANHQARMRIASIFSQALDQMPENLNLMKTVHKTIEDGLTRITNEISIKNKKKERIKRMKQKLKYKGNKIDLYEGVISQQLNDNRKAILHLESELEIANEMLNILSEYESTEPETSSNPYINTTTWSSI